MKVELTLSQLKTIKSWANFTQSECDINLTEWTAKDDDALEAIDEVIEQAQELEELDLDDCASGACKL